MNEEIVDFYELYMIVLCKVMHESAMEIQAIITILHNWNYGFPYIIHDNRTFNGYFQIFIYLRPWKSIATMMIYNTIDGTRQKSSEDPLSGYGMPYYTDPGARLTKAYDVTIQRCRNLHAKIEDSKIHILRCMGSKFCVKFQRFFDNHNQWHI